MTLFLEQMIQERRDAILKCLEGFRKHTPTVLISKVIERSKTDLPNWFVPWAPAVVIASDYLLQAAGHRPGSRRPKGWSEGEPDVFTKRKYGNQLMVRGCGELWSVERHNHEVLAFPFGPLPVFTETCQGAMRLAEYCHPPAQEGEWGCFPRPRGTASGLHWVVATLSGIKYC
jgi:hypothetical protein